MSAEDEDGISAEISQYSEQLAQIELILGSAQTDAEKAELTTLKSDLEQLIDLSKESLLELKKKKLLNDVDTMYSSVDTPVTHESTSQKDSKKLKEDSDPSDLIASKVRVYYNCPNTNLKKHNALVLGIQTHPMDQTLQVKVLFCNPTHKDMKICEHFMNDTCKFNTSCKYSHGHAVNVTQLEEYKEPNFIGIRIGMSCLAKYTDELWHLGTIESIDEENICVQYKKFNQIKALEWKDVFVLDEVGEFESEDESDSDLSTDEEYSLPLDNGEDEATTSKAIREVKLVKLGEWEKHTKGIGSKLMAKMGYVIGTGLGKYGEGRVEPVEAEVIPKEGNVSLDTVMELRQNRSLKKLKPKRSKKSKKLAEAVEAAPEINVFEFINNKLGSNGKQQVRNEETVTSLRKSNVTAVPLSKNSKGLNIQMLETHNQIKNMEKVVAKYKESLLRNKNSNKATISSIKSKLEEAESSLAQLKRSESAIQNEKSVRKRKSDVF